MAPSDLPMSTTSNRTFPGRRAVIALFAMLLLMACSDPDATPRTPASAPPDPVPSEEAVDPPAAGTPQIDSAALLQNGGAESSIDLASWQSTETCSVHRDSIEETATRSHSTAPGNGLAHYRLASGCTMVQQTEHQISAGDAISTVFDIALAAGSQGSLTAALIAVNDGGERTTVVEREFDLSSEQGDWQSLQLLSGFTKLDDFSGDWLALEFSRSDDTVSSIALDAMEMTVHRDDPALADTPLLFRDTWDSSCDERWVGEHYFANRLRDWKVESGRLVTSDPVAHRPLRTVHRVSSSVNRAPTNFTLNVKTGLSDNSPNGPGSWSGFLIGAGFRLDHRGAALIHNRSGRNGGMIAGLGSNGRAFIEDNGITNKRMVEGVTSNGSSQEGSLLQLDARYSSDGQYTLDLYVINDKNEVISSTSAVVPASRVLGSIALASGPGNQASTHWFDDFQGSGKKLHELPERNFGPVLFASHTLSRGTLTLNAQYPPTCENRFAQPVLQAQLDNGWTDVATATIDRDAYTARFSVPGWRASLDTPYRVKTVTAMGETHHYEGVVRADPINKPDYVLGLFNCRPGVILSDTEGWIQQNNARPFTWTRERIVVPHEELLGHAAHHEPDMIAFVGDQIYEFDPNGLIDKNSGPEALMED